MYVCMFAGRSIQGIRRNGCNSSSPGQTVPEEITQVPVLHVDHDSYSGHRRGYCVGYNVAQTLIRSIIDSMQKSRQDSSMTVCLRRGRDLPALPLTLPKGGGREAAAPLT